MVLAHPKRQHRSRVRRYGGVGTPQQAVTDPERGRCPVCRREFKLTPTGRLRAHLDESGFRCGGRGLEPQ